MEENMTQQLDSTNIKNYKPVMAYRRFGKTETPISAITLGGMRYVHGWEEPRDQIPSDMIDNCRECVELALKYGINHFETAYGYGKSEHCYGIVLHKELSLKRDSYYLMTKGAPGDATETRRLIEEQLKALGVDYFDHYAWHGINNQEIFEKSCGKGGPVEELLKIKEEGIIKAVGFSTHAQRDIIEKSIETDLFDFVNLHYYYFFQRNERAVQKAAQRDMGVFIISPNEKGGHLFNPSPLMKELTAPLTPSQFNGRFCLKTPQVQTLSFGMSSPYHFKQMASVVPDGDDHWNEQDEEILNRMDKRKELDVYRSFDGYSIFDDPSGINIPEILRYRQMWKCFDNTAFPEMRYNMFEEKGNWFPGHYVTEENLAKIDMSKVPEWIPLKELLLEVHQRFYKKKD